MVCHLLPFAKVGQYSVLTYHGPDLSVDVCKYGASVSISFSAGVNGIVSASGCVSVSDGVGFSVHCPWTYMYM